MTRLEDLADLTLIDENTKLILTDDANKEIPGLVEDLFEDIADVTLIDEDTKPILTDDANKEIPSNMTMQVAPPVGQICH